MIDEHQQVHIIGSISASATVLPEKLSIPVQRNSCKILLDIKNVFDFL